MTVRDETGTRRVGRNGSALAVAVPTLGADEVGRLAEHFNTMIRVLRDRAEEQGCFAAAGELLAGIAHEVNNPLMAIAAHAENGLADASLQGEQPNEMAQILRQARRATKLVRGLLRFVRAANGPGGGPTRSVRSLAGVRVLIVEDEASVRRPMVRYLTRKGAHVAEAGDGAEALTLLRDRPADVILADLRMPRMGGMELYAQLEDERPELAARVLFLSGDISQLAEPGNTPVPRERVLVKPVELAELERRILEFVRLAGA